jgi:ATP-dependent helicase HepA
VLRQPLGGLERAMGEIAAAIRRAERSAAREPLPREALVRDVHAGVQARERAVFHHLHQGGYSAAQREAILLRVPRELDALHERFVVDACELLGFESAERPGERTWYLELGGEAIVDSLPGVPGGTRYLGTFDRQEAVVREELEYFASGHPLVEGLLVELEDGSRGRAALLELSGAPAPLVVLGIVASDDGPSLVACDLEGRERPEWAAALLDRRRELRPVALDDWRVVGTPEGWPRAVRALERVFSARLRAVAAIRAAS